MRKELKQKRNEKKQSVQEKFHARKNDMEEKY